MQLLNTICETNNRKSICSFFNLEFQNINRIACAVALYSSILIIFYTNFATMLINCSNFLIKSTMMYHLKARISLTDLA